MLDIVLGYGNFSLHVRTLLLLNFKHYYDFES